MPSKQELTLYRYTTRSKDELSTGMLLKARVDTQQVRPSKQALYRYTTQSKDQHFTGMSLKAGLTLNMFLSSMTSSYPLTGRRNARIFGWWRRPRAVCSEHVRSIGRKGRQVD